eukprot:13291059-Heterocapsa_arctica.AAC.1
MEHECATEAKRTFSECECWGDTQSKGGVWSGARNRNERRSRSTQTDTTTFTYITYEPVQPAHKQTNTQLIVISASLLLACRPVGGGTSQS